MMPARRAAWSGSPFFTRPARIWRRASADIEIDPRAIASRSLTGLSPTSTIFTRPLASTCERRPGLPGPGKAGRRAAASRSGAPGPKGPGLPGPPGPPDPPDLFDIDVTTREIEGQALE